MIQCKRCGKTLNAGDTAYIQVDRKINTHVITVSISDVEVFVCEDCI